MLTVYLCEMLTQSICMLASYENVMWNYKDMQYNFYYGACCLEFAPLWIVLYYMFSYIVKPASVHVENTLTSVYEQYMQL